MTYRVYLCPVPQELVIPDPECPNSDRHTPCPPGYLQWHAWATLMHSRRSTQSRCRGCGLFNIWSSPTKAVAS